VRYHNGYKWIWLNKGSREGSNHGIEMYTIEDVVFADEMALREHFDGPL